MKPRFKALMALFILALLLSWYGCGQEAKPFSKTEIEQLVAPIALYPDPLLAQMLMASTYPLEIVEADRFVKANSKLKKKALKESLLKQPWDESVKALAAIPQILDKLNEKLDLTQKLGDAFLAQQKEVLDAVQTLRAKARQAGNLQSGKEQVVDNQHEGETSYITIEPVDPEIVYVPSYDPKIIFGTWPYPSDPPYEYEPSDQDKRRYFGAGLLTGHALWGNVDWNDKRVGIDVDRFNKFNRTSITNDRWQHRVEHRKGVLYRDLDTQEKFGKGPRIGFEAREAFRGRAEQAREQHDMSGHAHRPSQHSGHGFDQRRVEKNLAGHREQNPSNQEHSRFKLQSRIQAFDDVDRGRETRSFGKRGKTSRPSLITRGKHGGKNRAVGGGRRSGGRRR